MKFRMVDQIVSWESKQRICGVKAVSFEEYSLTAPFGGPARLPETLLLESFLQLGNWLIILSSDFTKMGLVIRLQRIFFEGAVMPGERLVMELTVRSYRDDGVLFDGAGRVGTRLVATGEGCLAVPVELASYCDPDDLRVLFSEIHRPQEGAPL